MNWNFINPLIQSIGIAVPPNKISQALHHSILESANGISRLEKIQLQKIYSRSGIKTRHSVLAEFGKPDTEENILFHPANHHPALPISKRMQLFQKFASELCVRAVKDCFGKISLPLNNVTHLVTFSCTGMSAPGLDIQLVEYLGLNRNIERTCVNFMGCYAGINALKVAYHIARSQPEAIVLVAGVELCTLHYQKNDKPDQLVANALFADGAAACVVTSKEISSNNKKAKLSILNFYSEFEPAGMNEMIWTIGDTGFDLRLTAEVPDFICKNISSLVQRLLDKASTKRQEIDYFAIHPGGMKILEACEEALSLSKEQNKISYDVLSNFGNMSSVTIFFVLNDYMNSFSVNDDKKKILACAFGPGLTMESMMAEVNIGGSV